jgi:hypothetical protein
MPRRTQKERRAAAAPRQAENRPLCGICLSPVIDNVGIPCKHDFCAECFTTWVKTKIKEREIIPTGTENSFVVLIPSEDQRSENIEPIAPFKLVLNEQGSVNCPVCNVTYTTMGMMGEDYHTLYRTAAIIHYAPPAACAGYKVSHYITDAFEIIYYTPKKHFERLIAEKRLTPWIHRLSLTVYVHEQKPTPLDLYAVECHCDDPDCGDVFLQTQEEFDMATADGIVTLVKPSRLSELIVTYKDARRLFEYVDLAEYKH